MCVSNSSKDMGQDRQSSKDSKHSLPSPAISEIAASAYSVQKIAVKEMDLLNTIQQTDTLSLCWLLRSFLRWILKNFPGKLTGKLSK